MGSLQGTPLSLVDVAVDHFEPQPGRKNVQFAFWRDEHPSGEEKFMPQNKGKAETGESEL